MKKIRLSENELNKIIKRVIEEQGSDRYMFFSNLEQIRRQCDILLSKNRDEIDSILDNGHDWAQDHIAEAKNNMDQVFDFLMNETTDEGDLDDQSDEEESDYMMEGRKKSGTKLCARGKSAAKAKFKVYPSAYANGHAVQVCKGRMPGADGKKKCSAPYC